MKSLNVRCYPPFHAVLLAAGLAFLMAACSSYSTSRPYPQRSYVYQPSVSPYHPNYQYRHSGYYYGSYQPGWFVGFAYPGAYYGGWGYSPLSYWPTYSHAYYRNSYYPYYDPWYYSYSSYYRYPYYSRYAYGAGYGGAYTHGNRAYYGGSHSYRPPGQQDQPGQNRPEPVVIPRDQRGRRGAGQDYSDEVADRLRQREMQQPERRSATVVSQEQGMSRSVSIAPGQAGDQGMTISSRTDRKTRPSRLEPVGSGAIVSSPDGSIPVQTSRQRAYSPDPAQHAEQAMPNTARRGSRFYGATTVPADQDARSITPNGNGASWQRPPSYSAPVAVEVPLERNDPAYRQAPSRQQPVFQPPPVSREPVSREPVYQQTLDAGRSASRAEPRQRREPERDRERQNP